MINAIEKEVAQKAVISFSSDSADGSTLIKNVNNADGVLPTNGL